MVLIVGPPLAITVLVARRHPRPVLPWEVQSGGDPDIDFRQRQLSAYEGLHPDVIPSQLYPPHIQMRAMPPTAQLLPKKQTQPQNNQNGKQLPAAAAGANAGVIIGSPTPGSGSAVGFAPYSAALDATSKQQQQALMPRRLGLFGSVRIGNSAPRPRALPDAGAGAWPERVVNWSAEEDDVLLKCVNEYGMNFQLIAQILQATPRLAGRLRSMREVQNRHAILQHKKAGGADPPQIQIAVVPKSTATSMSAAAAAGGGAILSGTSGGAVSMQTGSSLPSTIMQTGGSMLVPGAIPAAYSSSAAAASGSSSLPSSSAMLDDGEDAKKKSSSLASSNSKGNKSSHMKDSSKMKDGRSVPTSAANVAAASASSTGGTPPSKKKGPPHIPPPSSSPAAAGGATAVGFGTKPVISLIDRATKQMKNEQLAARSQLRVFLQLTSCRMTRIRIAICATCRCTTHIRRPYSLRIIDLGLPETAIGKTLMPHQIIQLKVRRQQHRMSGGAFDSQGRQITQSRPSAGGGGGGGGGGPPPPGQPSQQQQQGHGGGMGGPPPPTGPGGQMAAAHGMPQQSMPGGGGRGHTLPVSQRDRSSNNLVACKVAAAPMWGHHRKNQRNSSLPVGRNNMPTGASGQQSNVPQTAATAAVQSAWQQHWVHRRWLYLSRRWWGRWLSAECTGQFPSEW